MSKTNQENLDIHRRQNIETVREVVREALKTHRRIVNPDRETSLDHDEIDQQAKMGAIIIKGIMSETHIGNLGQRVIENTNIKQLK